MAIGYLFAGQGQSVAGLGHDLYQQEATYREVVDEAAAACGCDLADPEVWGQPVQAPVSLYTMSVGIAALLGAELPAPVAVMGLSLGEYAALTVAGSLSLPDGVRVVADRARWMQTAGDQVPGKMAAVMTDRVSTVQTLVQALPGVYVANKNAPHQIVVGGQVAVVDRLLAELAARGIKRVRSLNVVASHTPLMQTAADRLAARLQAVHFAPPRIPVISNTTGKPFTAATVKATLVNQLTHTTNFAGGLLALADLGVDQFVEIGPGRTLSGFVRQTLPRAARYQVHDVATFNQVRRELGVISDRQ